MKRVTKAKVHVVENLLSSEELKELENLFLDPKYSPREYNIMGRVHVEGVRIPNVLASRLEDLVHTLYVHEVPKGVRLELLNPPLYVEYNSKYGVPNVRPHYDGDFTDYIIDFQMSSNTSWSLGVDTHVYEMKDNSAVIFSPNRNVHWRPEKTFNEGEYLRAIFFRLFNPKNRSDYSHLPNHPDHEVFREARIARDSA